VMVATMYLSWW